MLKHLQIENYALIDKLDIEFIDGLTIITGETGAGKSILLGALSLILGQRADTQALMDKKKKCIIEGIFDIDSLNIKTFFSENDLDYFNPCIIRREINQQGKSRAFINDTPVNLNVLKEIGSKLIDIHSQHQNLLAAEASFQFDVLDNFCGHTSVVEKYRGLFAELLIIIRKNDELKAKESSAKAEQDYFRFQLDELDKAKLNPKEFEELESELSILENAELIKLNFEKAEYVLERAEPNINSLLNEVAGLMAAIENVSTKYAELYERIKSSEIEIKDISRELTVLAEDVSFDPDRVVELKSRQDLINKLLLKHNESSVSDLLSVQEDFRSKLNEIESIEDLINENEIKIKEKKNDVGALAHQISSNRKAAIPNIEKEITFILKQLGMPNARFKVQISDASPLNNNGKDELQFLFNANLGGELKEISKVASGGELSRLMLSIKSMISKKNLLPTIIFDEIDTGISGDIATKMGDILLRMSKTMQVISITHLAQIAARGKSHLLVYKVSDNNQTKTRVKALYNDERITEIATMLGGNKPTEVMIQTAIELVKK